jgi:hypothetical protein
MLACVDTPMVKCRHFVSQVCGFPCMSCVRVAEWYNTKTLNVWQGPRRPKLRDDRVNDRYIHMWLAIYISDDLSTQRATHGGILLHLATTRRLCCHAGEIHRTRCVPPNWMEPSCPQGPHEQQQPSSPTSRSFSILYSLFFKTNKLKLSRWGKVLP